MSIQLSFWQIDSFTNEPFKGNPAAVFILKEALSNSDMQTIANEMNLSETAFVLMRENSPPLLRWFTPICEIDLCGHATLAAAYVLFKKINYPADSIQFDTQFAGQLTVSRGDNRLTMDFPARPGEEINMQSLPTYIFNSLSQVKPSAAFKSRDLMLVYNNDKVIKNMSPNFTALNAYDGFIIVTAPSSDSQYDFVSRFFCADDGISEDPVTGSAHCTLGPYWAKILGKNKLEAYQASKRGGELSLEVNDNRILITGQCVSILEGSMSF